MAKHGANFESVYEREKAKRQKPKPPAPPPRAEGLNSKQQSPSPFFSEQFRQAIEDDGRVGRVQWSTGGNIACEHCPCSSTTHHVCVLLENGLPRLMCGQHGEGVEPIIKYNEWLRATWAGLYYHDGSARFWTREADPEKWMKLPELAAMDHLTRQGVPADQRRQVLLDVRYQYNTRYAGPLAGYRSGVYKMFGNTVLVTDSPIIIQPRSGAWPTLGQLLENIWGEVQLPYLLGWMKFGYESLVGVRRIGQALILVGEADSGKSLTQKIITLLLGGRVGRPYSYMSGKTDFNYDLFGCEHLAIEDQKASTDYRTRKQFGTALKDIVTVTEQRCHRKFADPITLAPFWRLSISLNDEPESLCVLPPLDKSIEDKVILLQANLRPMPMPTITTADYERFWSTLVSELPAFIHFLTNEWTMPAHLLSGAGASRFGMAHYHNPLVLQLINELEDEFKMLQLLDIVLWTDGKREVTETAEWFERKLLGNGSPVKQEANRVLWFAQACGKYFDRLSKKYPHRVEKRRTKNHNLWTVRAPSGDEAVQSPLL